MSNVELIQRIAATIRLDELAMRTAEVHTHPVLLLSEALRQCCIFLPVEVENSVEIILDATRMEGAQG
jgi:hypothetical protein